MVERQVVNSEVVEDVPIEVAVSVSEHIYVDELQFASNSFGKELHFAEYLLNRAKF